MLALAAGCGSGGPGPARPPEAGTAADAAVADVAVRDTAPLPADAGPDVSPDLPPLPPAALRLLMPGKPRLAGNGPTTCSSGPRSAETGTWCAFVKILDGGDGGEIGRASCRERVSDTV